MYSQLFRLISFAAVASLALGIVIPTAELERRAKVTDKNVCRPLAKGKCTLTVTDTLISVPSPDTDPGNTFAGAVDSNGQEVLDNQCNPLPHTNSVKPLGTGKGFGGDLKVKGWKEPIKFHATTIGPADIGGISFTFKGRKFKKCDCQNDSHGLTGKRACRCEFDCS